jgi:hypothetical protein
MARLRCSGFSPSDRAMEGSAVARTVESRFSMKSAQAMIMGISTWRGRAVVIGAREAACYNSKISANSLAS